jgi:hypothetical protein
MLAGMASDHANVNVIIGCLRTLATIAARRGPDHVEVNITFDPRSNRKVFAFTVDAREFEPVSAELGRRFGAPLRDAK